MRNRGICGDVGGMVEDWSRLEVQVLGYPRDLIDSDRFGWNLTQRR